MKGLFLVFLAGQLLFGFCFKKQFLQNRPQPMKNFVPEKATGRWYYIARFISCRYQGAREFTDKTTFMSLDPSRKFYRTRYNYRIGSRCHKLEHVRKIHEDRCAQQFLLDNIGNLYTGVRIVVASDYKNFLIEWGCLEYAQDKPNVCKDSLMNVIARTTDPSPTTRNLIDKILHTLFNIEMKDLELMPHNNPC